MLSFRHKPAPPARSGYDAFDFMAFMDDYMKAHPEVTIDQQYGWDIYWNPHPPQQEKTPRPVPAGSVDGQPLTRSV